MTDGKCLLTSGICEQSIIDVNFEDLLMALFRPSVRGFCLKKAVLDLECLYLAKVLQDPSQ